MRKYLLAFGLLTLGAYLYADGTEVRYGTLIRVFEPDGSPDKFVRALSFGNGQVTMAGSTAIITIAGGGGGGGGSLGIFDVNGFSVGATSLTFLVGGGACTMLVTAENTMATATLNCSAYDTSTTTLTNRLNAVDKSTAGFTLFKTTAEPLINAAGGFTLFKTTGQAMINAAGGFTLWKATGEPFIDALNLFRTTAEPIIDAAGGFTLFKTTGQPMINAAGGFTAFLSTGQTAIANGVGFAQFASTGQTAIRNGVGFAQFVSTGQAKIENQQSQIFNVVSTNAVALVTMINSTYSALQSTSAEITLWRSSMASAAHIVNQSTNDVSWNDLKDVPAGFADGTDDGAGGSSAGDSLGTHVATQPLNGGNFPLFNFSSGTILGTASVGGLISAGPITSTNDVTARDFIGGVTDFYNLSYIFQTRQSSAIGTNSTLPGFASVIFENLLSTGSQEYIALLPAAPADSNTDPVVLYAIAQSTGIDPSSITCTIAIATAVAGANALPNFGTLIWQSSTAIVASTQGIADTNHYMTTQIPLTNWKTTWGSGQTNIYVKVTNTKGTSTCQRYWPTIMISKRRRA